MRAGGKHMESADRRLDDRFDVGMIASVSATIEHSTEDGQAVVLSNISYGGFRSSKGGLKVGQMRIVCLPFLGKREVQVRWVEGGRAGCRFAIPLTQGELRTIVGAEPRGSYFPSGARRRLER